MASTFVTIRGTSLCDVGDYVQTFVVHHHSVDLLKQAINGAMNDIFKMRGMIITKDDINKGTDDFNNLKFIPMHMIAEINFETRSMVGEYPQIAEGEKVN